MSKDKISDYSATANSNTDIGGINIDEGCAPSGINDAIRTLMKQLKDWQSGSQDVYIHPAGSASVPSITATGDTNTGLFFPAADTVGITTGGTERARVDSSGNLGLGVTPTNNTLGKTLQVGQAGAWVAESGSNRWWLASNWYYNSGDKYINNGYATLYSQQNGSHQWQIAASGTAGNAITFTQAMTLDASGNLGVGLTSISEKLDVYQAARISYAGNSEYRVRITNTDGNGRILVDGNTTALIFGTSSSGAGSTATERARIDSSGNLLVGTTTKPDTNLTGVGIVSAVGNWALAISANNRGYVYSATNDGYPAYFVQGGSTVGYIATTSTTTTYATSSDYRLKNNIAPMTDALAKVAALKPVTYKWNADGSNGEGFIAHELAEVCPQAVTGEKDAVDEEGNPVYQGIDTSFLVATLTAALQELNAKFEAYKAAHP